MGLAGSCYFLQLCVDIQDEMGKFTGMDLDEEKWSWSFLTIAGTIPDPDSGTTCIKVPYKANILKPANATHADTATSATTATSAGVLTNKVLDSLTINSTAGTFSFQGNNIPWNGTDWVGLQVGSDNDKFQIHALNGTTLEYRQNDSGGTNSNWGDWYSLLSSGNYTDYTVKKDGTGATGSWGISVTGTSSNVTGTVAVENGGTGATSFTSGALLIGNGTEAIGTRTIKNLTAKGNLGWTNNSTDIDIPTINTLTYWDGRYNSSSSNLTYCVKGAFGDAAIKGVVTTLNTSANLPTAGAVSTALGNYVTLTTEQTISGHKTFSNLVTFKNSTGSEYCNINYN